MSADVSREESPRRFQFPLWALLFVIPTVVAMICGSYIPFRKQLERRTELQEQIALAENEIRQHQRQAMHLRRSVEEIGQTLDHWRRPDAVIEYLLNPDDHRAYGYGILYSGVRSYPSDMQFFFARASDDDLKLLVRQMTAVYPGCNAEARFRILACLSMFPEFVPDRLHVVAKDVQRLATRQQDDPDEVVAITARDALKAFGLPTKEEKSVSNSMADEELRLP